MVQFLVSGPEQGGRNFAPMCCTTRTFCRFFATVILRSTHNLLRCVWPLSATSSLRRPAGKHRLIRSVQCQRNRPRAHCEKVCLTQSGSKNESGNGGKQQQLANAGHTAPTADQRIALVGSQNPLRGNVQGPILLEDCTLRGKTACFAHEYRKPGIRALVSAYVSFL